MNTSIAYKGFDLQTNPVANTGSCLIYKQGNLLKCFASDETATGKDSVTKAKEWIDKEYGCEYKGVAYTADQIEAMREWISDCQWPDLEPDEVEYLSDCEILKGVQANYGGGLDSFVLDCIPC